MMIAGDFDKFPDPIGVGGSLSLVLIVVAEFVSPLLIMAGLATRLAAIPTVGGMAVAAFIVHGNDPWTLGAGASKEPALLYLIPYLTLVFTGAGGFSLDAFIWPRLKRSGHPPAASES